MAWASTMPPPIVPATRPEASMIARAPAHCGVEPFAETASATASVRSACDRPLRLAAVEAAIDGRVIDGATVAAAVAATQAAVDPEDDIHAGGAYRRVLRRSYACRAHRLKS